MPYHVGYDYKIDSPNRSGNIVPPSSLLNGLIGYWYLDEASGNRVDATGNGNTLTDNNSTPSVAKGVGAPANLPALVASFTTASQNSLSRAFFNLDTSLGYTLAAWLYFPTGSPTDFDFASNGAQQGVDDNVHFGAIGAGNQRIFMSSGVDATEGAIGEQGGGNQSLDAWHFYVGRYDASTKKVTLAKDNVVGTASAALAINPVFAVGIFGIGCGNITNSPARWMTGRVSCVGLWNKTLSVGDGTSLWSGGNAAIFPFTGIP